MKYIFFPILVFLLLSACNHSHEHVKGGHEHGKTVHENHDHENESHSHGASDKEATFVHTVFFWMKEDLTVDEAKFFEEGMDMLGKTPSILSYKWGKPAGTQREVVDNSYTYAWIVDFATTEDQDAYQVDPIHLKFIEESKHLWTKVQVYDTILD